MTIDLGSSTFTVQSKGAWSDDWGNQPYLEPLQIVATMMPTIPHASFLWRYGVIQRDDDPAGGFRQVDRLIAPGPWVRVLDSAGRPVWTGLLESQAETIAGDAPSEVGLVVPAPTGDQVWQARGVEALLTRLPIDHSACWINETVVRIRQALPFNLPGRHGNQILGNRSAEKHGNSYTFSPEGAVWTGRDIVEYLVDRFTPSEFLFALTGQLENLAAIERIWPAPDTVAEGLARVIDRRRGHAWRVDCEGDEPAVDVRCIFDSPITVGEVTLQPNDDIITIDVSDDEAAGPVHVRSTPHGLYDRVEVHGSPMVICGTLAVSATGLVKAWSDDSETAYLAGDWEERNEERYAHVFTTYRLPDTWCRTFDQGQTVWPFDSPGWDHIWTHGASLLRQLPLRVGTDYSVNPPVITDEDVAAEFMAPLVCAPVTLADGTEVMAALDAIDTLAPPNMAIRTLDGTLGIHVKPGEGTANVRLARGHIGTSDAYGWAQDVDYEDLLATVAIATAEPVRKLAWEAETALVDGSPRTLVIDVPGIEAWLLREGTVVGIRDGALLRCPADVWTRNDMPALDAVAAVARAWYSRPRNAIELAWADLKTTADDGQGLRPGALLAAVVVHATRTLDEAAGMVTAIAWDCRAGTTSLTSDFGELDFVAAAGRGPRGSASIPIPSLTAPADRDRTVNLPIRPAAPGHGGPRRAVLTAAQQMSGYYAWTYTARWAIKNRAAHGDTAAADDYSLGDEVTCYNDCESINSAVTQATDSYGDGVTKADLEEIGTFTIPPVPLGTPVWLYPEPIRTAQETVAIEWRFAIPTSPTGMC